MSSLKEMMEKGLATGLGVSALTTLVSWYVALQKEGHIQPPDIIRKSAVFFLA